MKQLPVGVQDFISVREGQFYYVDKSMLIGQILNLCPNGVFSITRPRRFGKSLNLSMLDAFFNIKYKGNTWFDGLEISKHPEYDRYKNAFPVISISLKFDDIKNYEDFIEMFNSKLFEVFDNFTYLRNSPNLNEDNIKMFDKYYSGEKTLTDSKVALSKLCTMLKNHHNSKVVVLIDEYDATVNDMENEKLRRRITSFLGAVLSPLLKESTSRQLGVLTGITQVMTANDFGGFNNVIRDDILNTHFGDMYGFTEDEVKQICADYGHPEKFEEVKEWYGGYRFNESEVCNPRSILNYIQKNFKPDSYWVETGGNREIYNIISKADDELTDYLQILTSGGTITEEVNTILFSDGYRSIYSLLAIAGYLRAVPKGQLYELSIPNRELLSVFSYGKSSGSSE